MVKKWRLTWQEFNEVLGVTVTMSFRTTDEMIEQHKLALENNFNASNIQVSRVATS